MKRMALVVGLVLVFSSLSVTEGQDLFELKIICLNTYEFRMEYAETIADEFAAVGIDVSLDFVSPDELRERVSRSEGRTHDQGGFDVAIFALGFESGSEADTIYRLFHSDNSVRKGDGENYASWENTENDLLIDMILEEQDERKLYQYWFEWQSLFHEEQPLAPIYYYYVMGENEEQSWVAAF